MAATLRRLALPIGESLWQAISEFCCVGEGDEDDPVAANVNSFLVDDRFRPGIEHGISATYLLIDPEKSPALLGYATLTFDSVRLTNTEKKTMESLVGIAEFGSVRIQMIGIDHRHQRCGCGVILLEGITGLARKLSEHVAVRFILADANKRKVSWYEKAGFVPNQAKREVERLAKAERSISMRLDLSNPPA